VSRLLEACPDKFSVLSGDDALTLPFMAVGAEGVISVASNLLPRAVVRMVRAFREGDVARARRMHARYHRLFKDLFLETNPVPVKAAMAMMGLIREELRLPLVPLAAVHRAQLRATLKSYGLLRPR
jgi:4-hydroxy-tetrahydrodipicolinate synthase